MRTRRSIVGLDAYVAGRSEASVQRELGLDHVIKLASNESPLGPFPSALAALRPQEERLNRYPERDFELAEQLADLHHVTLDQVQLGNGADPIIGWLSTAYLDPGDEIVSPWPSFVSYRLDAIKMDARPVLVPLRDGFHDLETMLERIGPRTRIVYVCNPNNPTGTIVDRESLRRFVDAVPEEVLIVIDEAYAEFVDDPNYPDAIAELFPSRGNVAVLRTFSKLYALAGLRVGYMVAPAGVVADVGKIRHYFDVSDLGHVAASASLADTTELQRRRELNAEGRVRLVQAFTDCDCRCLPSATNFVAADVGDGVRVADELLARGIITRPLASFGSSELLRVTVGTPDELDAFAAALPGALEAAGIAVRPIL